MAEQGSNDKTRYVAEHRRVTPCVACAMAPIRTARQD